MATSLSEYKKRFFAKVVKTEHCWVWIGAECTGYGHFLFKSKARLSHRVSFEFENGPIPDGLLVMHKCDNRKCVRPSHLMLGTHKDNTADMYAKGRAPNHAGENNSRSILKFKDVLEIRELARIGATVRNLAERYGVGTMAIRSLLAGRTWRCVE